jgi:hypothetical protein
MPLKLRQLEILASLVYQQLEGYPPVSTPSKGELKELLVQLRTEKQKLTAESNRFHRMGWSRPETD